MRDPKVTPHRYVNSGKSLNLKAAFFHRLKKRCDHWEICGSVQVRGQCTLPETSNEKRKQKDKPRTRHCSNVTFHEQKVGWNRL